MCLPGGYLETRFSRSPKTLRAEGEIPPPQSQNLTDHCAQSSFNSQVSIITEGANAGFDDSKKDKPAALFKGFRGGAAERGREPSSPYMNAGDGVSALKAADVGEISRGARNIQKLIIFHGKP